MGGRFVGCTAYIYDPGGEMLASTKIYDHDGKEHTIEVSGTQALQETQKCELLILSSPVPYACSGIIHPDGASMTIKLFKGEERENRRSERFKLTGKATITSLICGDKVYGLHTPIEAELINISASGVRIKARYNTLSIGDKFNLCLMIKDDERNLSAKVVNNRDNERESSEYGCVFLGDAYE